MSLTRHIEPEDLALFAMQLLSKDEARAVAAHVEECPDCRQQLAEVQGDLAVYAHAVDMHSPPALARERLMKQVAREKKVVPIEPPGGNGVSEPHGAGLPDRARQWGLLDRGGATAQHAKQIGAMGWMGRSRGRCRDRMEFLSRSRCVAGQA